MRPANDTNIGRILGAKYRIDSVMRGSELGKVYNATHLSMDKKVAVKILSPVLAVDDNIRHRFTEEARRLSQVSHPNILNVIDFGADGDGTEYIVYEGVEGVSLKDEIVIEGALGIERILDITEQIAAGMVAAHSKGIVHGSLGGDKVMLTKDAKGNEIVKILELGSASHQSHGSEFERGNSIEYLSSEQCADMTDFDERSDIYSLGVMMYEMLSGQLPFNGSNIGEIMMKQATQPPPSLSSFRQDMPEQLEPIVLSALAKNRDLRYQSMGEVLADLSALSEVTLVSPTKAGAAQDDNNIWKTAFIVLSGISLLAIGLIYFTYVKKTDPDTVVQGDANGMPVQPINPATGINEQGLATIIPMSTDMMSQMAPQMMPSPMTDPVPGGDGFNAWSTGAPPPGAPPVNIPPGGQTVTVNPDGSSPFMPPDSSGYYLVPSPTAAPVQPSPTPAATPKTDKSPAPATPKASVTPKDPE